MDFTAFGKRKILKFTSEANFFMIMCDIPNTLLVLTLKNWTWKLCVSLDGEESWLCQRSQELWGKSNVLPAFSGSLTWSN